MIVRELLLNKYEKAIAGVAILGCAIVALWYFEQNKALSVVPEPSEPEVETLISWDTLPSGTIEAKYQAGDNIIIMQYLIKDVLDQLADCKEYVVDDEYILFSTEHTVYQVYKDQLEWHIENQDGQKCSEFDSESYTCLEWNE